MTRDRKRFWCWIAAILLIVVPWSTFQSHSHWARVAWVPFLTGPFRLRDIILNTLLYFPLGYWHTRAWPLRARWWHTLALALLLASATELTQVFSHRRYPTATDITCNAVGALCGAAWARARGSAGRRHAPHLSAERQK